MGCGETPHRPAGRGCSRERCSLLLNRALIAAVGAAAIQIDQNIARFGAFARADDAAIFQFIHDARGAGVAEAQAALQQGDAGLLFAADDLDALLDDFLILIDAAFVAESCSPAWKAA